mmetsp:Transcript_21245/g.46108  ORF Transcript_21245/g.46108 Transcript_21245/m.46108 type:complete len:294 (-) Transcript_21245:297-1178(-)
MGTTMKSNKHHCTSDGRGPQEHSAAPTRRTKHYPPNLSCRIPTIICRRNSRTKTRFAPPMVQQQQHPPTILLIRIILRRTRIAWNLVVNMLSPNGRRSSLHRAKRPPPVASAPTDEPFPRRRIELWNWSRKIAERITNPCRTKNNACWEPPCWTRVLRTINSKAWWSLWIEALTWKTFMSPVMARKPVRFMPPPFMDRLPFWSTCARDWTTASWHPHHRQDGVTGMVDCATLTFEIPTGGRRCISRRVPIALDRFKFWFDTGPIYPWKPPTDTLRTSGQCACKTQMLPTNCCS